MRRLIALLPLLLAQPTSAQSGVSRARVEALLQGVERSAGPSAWRALGRGAVPTLIAVYRDPRAAKILRLRAVSVLANYPEERVHVFLLDVAGEQEQEPRFVRQALLALASGFGEAATSHIAPFLDVQRAPEVRRAAVHALERIGSAAALAALRARLTHETDPLVSEALRAALSRGTTTEAPR